MEKIMVCNNGIEDIYKDKELDLEEMTKIFQGLLPILEDLKNYLLSEKMILLDPAYIFEEEEEKPSIFDHMEKP